MSCLNPKHHSRWLQNNQPPSIQEIVEKLSDSLKALSVAKDEACKLLTLLQPADKGVDSKLPTHKPNPLDKACNELKNLIRAFEKLEEFEPQLSEPISILEKNVRDILAALQAKHCVKDLIETNLQVLSSNIIKVKVQIPLLHQASTSSKASYLQTKSTTKDMENVVVKKRLLRFWWEGEKLLSETKEEKMEKLMLETEEECSVNKILEKFVEMGFVEPVTKGSRSQGYPDENFFKSKKLCLVKSKGSSWWTQNVQMEHQKNRLQEEKRVELQKKRAKHDKNRLEVKKKRVELERKRAKQEKMRNKYTETLQTLFNVSIQYPELPEELFSQMKNIDSLSNLDSLSILDLRSCQNLEKLPKEVRLLKNLAYLDISECILLDSILVQLSELSNLKVLKSFIISNKSPCSLQHLTKLTKLKKLSIHINCDHLLAEEEAQFFKFSSLKKLKITWEGVWRKKEQKNTDSNTKTNEEAKCAQSEQGTRSNHKTKRKEARNSGLAAMVFQKLKSPCGSGRANGEESSHTKQAGKEEKTMKLSPVKLDLQCYPERELPTWLVPETLTSLKRLYIRGGRLSNLGEFEKQWNVKILRLKYLLNIKMNWKELQLQFPKL
ncbi:hypothetical protein V6N11_034501 [Hibiscus sabdariffa]|uniref:Uncharacterized protein n=1 Tax=Hibiscus sabdariffa TaxID=183260 RepID=A0ABR1ZYZ3_9ROSI